MARININDELVKKARQYALDIACDVQSFIDLNTTVATERSIARLLGIDGVNEVGIPYPNIIIDHIKENGVLGNGLCLYLGNAMFTYNISALEVVKRIDEDGLNICELVINDVSVIQRLINKEALKAVELIDKNVQVRNDMLAKSTAKDGPLLYLIVATGNIYEDVEQAKAAVLQGADIIAVIRTTGQSLLDFVPFGATTEGFGGTYATQENFKIMRKALDEIGLQENRYIRLCNYCSGLCMPEIAAMGAIERLDVMLNDALYGILFRDINMKRTLVDQYFSRVINGYAKVIINTGEDNYLTTSDAITSAHTVLASQFINEQFALKAGMKEEFMGLGHAYEIDPDLKDSFVLELAQAQMVRQIFDKAPLKYMPPTKFMTGNIFKGQVQDALFNMVSIMTDQKLHLLGMMSEAIHTPFISDRYIALENAQYIFNAMASFGNEIEFKKDGIMQQRCDEVLNEAVSLLEKIASEGLFSAIEKGMFADVKRASDGGKGLDGVCQKDLLYFNPFIELMKGTN